MKKKKIAIIGTVGIPARYGGFETLAEHLVRHLTEEYEVTVYCTRKKYSREERRSEYAGARLIYLPFDANGIQSIFYDCLSILHALFFADVLLVLGVSGGILLPFVRRFTNKRLIVSIDGIEWKRDKWIRPARWYLWWAEKQAVKYSHADIADNEAIQDYTAQRYGTLSNIIEYGADHTLQVPVSPEDLAVHPFLRHPYAFTVCRIEPENNIHLILEAFAGIGRLPMVMVGNWDHSDYGRQLKGQYGAHPNITLLDPIYNQRRLDLLRGHTALYVHGHSAGGTNPSLVEAMYLGRPVLAYRVSYNRATTEGKAWYFTSVAEIVQVVEQATTDGLAVLGSRMKEIADRRYVWPVIARKYHFLVRQVLASSAKTLVKPVAERLDPRDLLDHEMAHMAHPLYFYEKK